MIFYHQKLKTNNYLAKQTIHKGIKNFRKEGTMPGTNEHYFSPCPIIQLSTTSQLTPALPSSWLQGFQLRWETWSNSFLVLRHPGSCWTSFGVDCFLGKANTLSKMLINASLETSATRLNIPIMWCPSRASRSSWIFTSRFHNTMHSGQLFDSSQKVSNVNVKVHFHSFLLWGGWGAGMFTPGVWYFHRGKKLPFHSEVRE